MEDNAATKVPAVRSGFGAFGSARSSDTGGGPNEISIPFGAFVYNDKDGGLSGVWGYYGTAVRAGSANGPTHIFEGDVTNLGTTTILTPAHPAAAGQTDAAWLACGGEYASLVHGNPCSVALGIISNSLLRNTPFEKGILFDQKSLTYGTDRFSSAGRTSTAIAFGADQYQRWYDGTDQVFAQAGAHTTIKHNGAYEIAVRGVDGEPTILSLGGFASDAFAASRPIASGTDAHPWSTTVTQRLTIARSSPPESSSASCTQGTLAWDGDYLYICVAANKWKRSALEAF
jgi:hypothetical protein